MRCTYCGSIYLVWDHISGDIVCGECGVVQDRIYDTGISRFEDIDLVTTKRRKTHHKLKVGKIYKRYNTLLARRFRKLRKNVIIPEDAMNQILSGVKSKTKMFRHVSDSEIEKLINRHPVLNKVIDIIGKYPRLTSRTYRGKVAIAFLAMKNAYESPLSISTISKALNISRVQVRRLNKLLKSYPKLISEVKSIVEYSDFVNIEKDLSKISSSASMM